MPFQEIADPFRRLVRIMERLQEPGGCPWDLEQTHESLKPYMIEEAYEATDAIDRADLDDLAEELGDVMLQVLFHAALARRTHGRFTVDDICRAATAKMVNRHPHVFGDTTADTPDQVLANWERLKGEERKAKAAAGGANGAAGGGSGDGMGAAAAKSALSGVPASLPALLRCQRMQEKAARVGFDWPDAPPAFDKVAEELEEVRRAVADGDAVAAKEELGDLLLAVTGLARKLDIDAEDAARAAAEKFRRRFEAVETAAAARGMDVKDLPPADMEAAWNTAKGDG